MSEEVKPVFTNLLALVRESGAEFGLAVGRDENEEIVDVQVAASGESAKDVVLVLEELEKWWQEEDRKDGERPTISLS